MQSVVTLQGKGMMRTFWLTGLHVVALEDGEDDDGELDMETDQPFGDNEFSMEDLKENGLGDDASMSEEIKGGQNGVGKISVADSGICIDKSTVVTEENDHNNIDIISGDTCNSDVHDDDEHEVSALKTSTETHNDIALRLNGNYNNKLQTVKLTEIQENKSKPNGKLLPLENCTDHKESTNIRFHVLPVQSP
jgi:hypothetical protein